MHSNCIENFTVWSNHKALIHFEAQSHNPSVATGNQWSGPEKSKDAWFHWSPPLVSRSNWSDRGTESQVDLGHQTTLSCYICFLKPPVMVFSMRLIQQLPGIHFESLQILLGYYYGILVSDFRRCLFLAITILCMWENKAALDFF